MTQHYFKALSLCLAILLAGCTTVPISTMVKLRKFDMATTDTAKLRVGVRAPKNIDVEKDGATLLVVMWSGKNENKFEHKFILERVTDIGEFADLQRERKSGFALHIFRLNPKDAAAIADFRARHEKLKAHFGDDVHGSISVGAQACYRNTTIDGPVLVTTYMKSAETGHFVTLTREIDVSNHVEKSKIKKQLTVCSDQPT